MADPYRAFRQLERLFELNLPVRELSAEEIRKNSERICTIVYNRETRKIEYIPYKKE